MTTIAFSEEDTLRDVKRKCKLRVQNTNQPPISHLVFYSIFFIAIVRKVKVFRAREEFLSPYIEPKLVDFYYYLEANSSFFIVN